MAEIIFLAGGNSVHSRLTGLLDFSTHYLADRGVDSEVIQIHQLPGDALTTADDSHDAIKEANQKVEESQVVFVVSPVYKASYSGVLKTYLDVLPQKAFANKTVVPLVIGGSFGHLLVIDYALKPVLAALGATNILQGVYSLNHQITKLDNHQFALEEGVKERLSAVLDTVLDQVKVAG